MAYKEDLEIKAKELGIELNGTEKVVDLESKITGLDPNFDFKGFKNPLPKSLEETMVPLSEVKKLIAEAMAKQSEENKPIKVKKVTEHHAHVWRFDGQWVVDFADRNFDYKTEKIIDPYIKQKIHAFNKFNPEKREQEAWITLILKDGTMKEVQLNRYIEHRTLVYCPIVKRETIDASYSIGEVDVKEEKGDRNVSTGRSREQEVEMYYEVFHVKTPDGDMLTLPDYVIC